MKMHTPAGLATFDGLLGLLDELAVEQARELARKARVRKRRPRGRTLRPGADTPAWLALAKQVRPLLAKRGAKTLLGRELGLHCSRITEFFIHQTAMPDAERTLLLLGWLSRQSAPVGPKKSEANQTP